MTKLTNRIININNRRTSMRLCQKEWNALEDICKREKINRNLLIEQIENNKNQKLFLRCYRGSELISEPKPLSMGLWFYQNYIFTL